MDGNGKKKKNLRFGKKIFLSSSKTGKSVGNAKQTIFYFWPKGRYLQDRRSDKNPFLKDHRDLYRHF